MSKSKKAEIESSRGIFLLIGLVTTLTFTLLAFEWKSYDLKSSDFSATNVNFEKDFIQNTLREKPKVKIPSIVLADKFILSKNSKSHDFRNDVLLPDAWDPDVYMDTADNYKYDMEFEPFYEFPQIQCEFTGDINQFLSENIIYPQLAVKNNIQGTVYVQFVVGATGKIRDIKIIRGVHSILDDESRRVIEKMPNWKPAQQGATKVATTVRVPIKFYLKDF